MWKKAQLFGDRPFYRRVVKITLPIVIQGGITNLVTLLDNVMVGQLGTARMSGVAIANQLLNIPFFGILGALSGIGIFTAQFFGKDDPKGLKYTFRCKVFTGILSLLFFMTVLFVFGDELIGLYIRFAGSEGSEAEKNITMAEAKTMRAFYYWRLVNTYALPYNDKQTSPATNPGVPLVTESEVKDVGASRASVADVYAQIISDIEEACSLFGNDTSSRGVYRINYTSAHLLASRIYLFTEQWDKVIEHADKAMATAPALVSLKSYNIDNTNNPTNGVISKKFGETIFLCGMKAMSGDYGLVGTPFGVSKDLANLYETMDRRMNTYIVPSGYDYYPYRILKVCSDEHEYTWRTAELYLNRAEAYTNLYLQGN